MKLVHRIAAIPWVYDLVQNLAGAEEIMQRLSTQLEGVTKGVRVLDTGGGTGIFRSLLPDDSLYICLDNDPVKVQGFSNKKIKGYALVADGRSVPLPSGSIDWIFCINMAHHLDNKILPALIEESFSLLKPGGKLLFMDPVLSKDRWKSRLLWKYDRGDFPRLPETLRKTIERFGIIEHWETFIIHHEYILIRAVRKQA